MPSATNRRSGVAERRAAFEARILTAVERLLSGGERYTDRCFFVQSLRSWRAITMRWTWFVPS